MNPDPCFNQPEELYRLNVKCRGGSDHTQGNQSEPFCPCFWLESVGTRPICFDLDFVVMADKAQKTWR